MIEPWVLILVLFFVFLFGLVIVIGMRILTTLEIIARAIPLGSPKILERPAAPPADRPTRPVGSTAQHSRG